MPETFPAIEPASAEWALISNTQQFTSPLSGTTQTLALPGSRWACRLVFAPLLLTNRQAMAAFLAKLGGPAGRFYFGDPAYKIKGPRGGNAGTPLIAGASQTGASLDTDGWDVSITDILKAGDYFCYDTSAGRELLMVTADADSDAGGAATLSIAPGIRTSPADNAVITVVNPTCIMRLADDNQARFAYSAAKDDIAAVINLDIVEAFFS